MYLQITTTVGVWSRQNNNWLLTPLSCIVENSAETPWANEVVRFLLPAGEVMEIPHFSSYLFSGLVGVVISHRVTGTELS